MIEVGRRTSPSGVKNGKGVDDKIRTRILGDFIKYSADTIATSRNTQMGVCIQIIGLRV
jgi:hypothetical protein